MANEGGIKKIGTKGTGYIRKERSVMFSEACIKHLRSLVNRGRQHEKPRWDIFEIMTSVGGTFFVFGAGSLLTTTFDKEKQLGFYIAIWVIMIVGIIIGIIGMIISFKEDKKHISCLTEIEEILQSQESLYEPEETSS